MTKRDDYPTRGTPADQGAWAVRRDDRERAAEACAARDLSSDLDDALSAVSGALNRLERAADETRDALSRATSILDRIHTAREAR